MDDPAVCTERARTPDTLRATLVRMVRQTTATDIPALMASAHDALEGHPAGSGIDCGPGCPFCCVVTVSALLPEVAAIALWLREHLSVSGWELLQQRLDHTVARIAWMEQEERIGRQIFCAFLDEAGSCLIHPVRPLLCRGVTSTDRNRCRQALQGESGSGAVIMDMELRGAAEATFIALAGSLEDAGLDCRSVELMRGVQAFLKQPELTARFLSGSRLEELHG